MKDTLAPQHRQRIIILSYLSFASLGLCGGAFGPSLPTLARQMDTSLDAAGGLISTLSVGYLMGGLTAGSFMEGFGRRRFYLTALGVTSISLLAILGTPSLAFGMLITFCLGLGQASMDVASHVVTGDAAREDRGAALNRLHFFFAAGALIGPILVGYGLTTLGSLWPAFGLTAALTLSIAFFMTLTPLPTRSPTHASASSDVRTIIGDRKFWFLAAFFFTYVGTEVGLGTWTFTLLHEGLGSDVTLASWATSGFFLALTVGRLAGARLAGRKVADERLVLVGIGGAIGGALLLFAGGAAQTALLLVVAVLAVGFCFGPLYPTTMGLAQRRYASAASTVVGLLTAAASTGGMFLPWLQGWLLAHGGLLWGVAATGVGVTALLAIALAFMWKKPENPTSSGGGL